MSFRKWLNIATLVIIVITLFTLRSHLVTAWHLLGQVNLWLLLLIIPLQFISYYATGQMVFSYLKEKNMIKNAGELEMTRMALELNFVNHILPTGGVSGASYMTWRLQKLGVTAGRATLAQVIRFAASFMSFIALLLVAVILMAIDGSVNRFVLLVSSSMATFIVFGLLFTIYILGSEKRMKASSEFISRWCNRLWRRLTRRPKALIDQEKLMTYLAELHTDYVELRREPRLFLKPFIWGIVFNIAEVSLYVVVFLSLGSFINPAPILIGLGLAAIIGFFLITPGGAGGYEALLILFLTTVGINQGIVLAGVLLARTLLILLTISSGYVFYHLALRKYGKHPDQR